MGAGGDEEKRKCKARPLTYSNVGGRAACINNEDQFCVGDQILYRQYPACFSLQIVNYGNDLVVQMGA